VDLEEYRRHDAVGLAALVRDDEVTAGELLELAIARAEQVDPALNGITVRLDEQARQRAGGPLAGPLAGVPMLTKDFFQEIAGVPDNRGNRARRDHGQPATRDSTLVARWKAAGLVPFGRTATPEFAAKGVTEPVTSGPTRNPWDLDRTPGGSSGGSAAMVAAGVVPVAGGNDGGGSIRIPAGACGLFGLKPGRGRTPWGPGFTEASHGIAVNHVLTRSVRDSAVLLDVESGPERGSLFHPAPPSSTYAEAAARPPGTLRIGVSTASPLGTDVDPQAVRAVERTVGLLEELGHEVVEAAPAIDGLQASMDWLTVWFAEMALRVQETKQLTGHGDEGFELDTLAMAAFGRATPAHELVACQERWQQVMIALDAFLETHDLWLTPTSAGPPVRIGQLDTPAAQRTLLRAALRLRAERLLLRTGLLEQLAIESLRHTPFTQFANITGVPAMSVPLHWCEGSSDAAGVPIGSQFVGGHGDEGLLLSLAAQLEEAAPWADRVPG
jgi:amidase